MLRYLKFIHRFRWWIALGVPLMVMTLILNLPKPQIDGSYRIWFDKESKILTDYDNFRQTFGNDDALIIAFRDPKGIFTPKALKSIQRITQSLWKMPYISRVDALTNYQYIYANPQEPDDIMVEDFIQESNLSNPDYLANRQKIALQDPLIRDAFISKDGTTTMIVARLVPKVNDEGDKSLEIMQNLQKILIPEAQRTGYKYWVNGGPALTEAFITVASADMIFVPMILTASMILLFLLFRRVGGALIPIGVVSFTFLTVIAIQILLGYKLNNFTINLPTFIIAIGIADAVHIYSVWLLLRKEGKDNFDATKISLEKNFLPIFLTSLTTTIGFATLTISHVVPVFTLGIATASGAILAFIISILWMPAVLLLLNQKIEPLPQVQQEDQSPLGYGAFILRNNKKIILITGAIFTLLSLGLSKVRIDSNTIRYFDKEVEIRQSAEFIMAHLTGPMAYEIIIDSKQKNGIKNPQFLKTVELFYQEFQAKYPDVRHLSSLMEIIKRFNQVVNHQDEIPNNQNLIAQYLLLYSLSLPQGMEINDKMDIDEQKLRITAQVNIVDTSKDLEMIHYVHEWWSKTPYSASVQGQTAMFAYMQRDVTNTLIYSLSLAVILVSLVMLLIFQRPRLLWVFILPNLLPVVLVVGLMGWIEIPIDIGVAIAGAIIIGVAVDDTIHFLVKYFEARKMGLSIEETFDEVLRYAGKAILFTTIILSGAFSIFAFSNFAPNQNFGIVTAFALIVALVVDLLLLPALLSLTDRESKPM